MCVGYRDNHNHAACLFALTSRHAEAAVAHLDIKELLADLQAPVDHLRVEREIANVDPPLHHSRGKLQNRMTKQHLHENNAITFFGNEKPECQIFGNEKPECPIFGNQKPESPIFEKHPFGSFETPFRLSKCTIFDVYRDSIDDYLAMSMTRSQRHWQYHDDIAKTSATP